MTERFLSLRRSTVSLIILSLFASQAVRGRVVPEETIVKVGISAAGQGEIELNNELPVEIKIAEVRSSCGCLSIGNFPKSIQSRGKAKIQIAFVGSNEAVEHRVAIAVSYDAGEQRLIEQATVDIVTLSPNVHFTQNSFNFGRTAAVFIKPIQLIVQNGGAADLVIDKVSSPDGFEAEIIGLGANRTLAASRTAFLRLEPHLLGRRGDVDSTVSVRLHQSDNPDIAMSLDAEIRGGIVAPSCEWSDGDQKNFDLSSPLPSIHVAIPREKIKAVSFSGPLVAFSLAADTAGTVVNLQFKEPIALDQVITGYMEVFVDDPRCPMFEFPINRCIRGNLTLDTVVQAKSISLTIPKQFDDAKLTAIYEVPDRPVDAQYDGLRKSASFQAIDGQLGAMVEILWKCGAIEKRYVAYPPK